MRIVRVDSQDVLTDRQRSTLARLVDNVADEVDVDVDAWTRQDLVVYTVQDYEGGPRGQRLVVAPRAANLNPGDEAVSVGWTAVLNVSGWSPPDELDLHVAGALVVITD